MRHLYLRTHEGSGKHRNQMVWLLTVGEDEHLRRESRMFSGFTAVSEEPFVTPALVLADAAKMYEHWMELQDVRTLPLF